MSVRFVNKTFQNMFKLDDRLIEVKKEDKPPVSFTNMEVKKSNANSIELSKERLLKKLEFLKINFDS